MSAPDSAAESAGVWDIAVSCDIRLGTIFRHFPELRQDNLIQIDPTAIESILTTFSPDSAGGSLLFEACHDDSLSPNTVGETELTNPGAALNGGKPSVIARVCIGGAGIPDEGIYRVLKNIKKDEPHKPSSKDIKTKLSLSSVFIPGSLTQDVSVHELRHAADYSNPEMLNKERRHRWLTLGKLSLGIISAGCAALSAAEILPNPSTHKTKKAFRMSKAVIATLVGAVGWALSPKTQQWLDYREYSSPMEVVAYNSRHSARKMPRVITITSSGSNK